MEKKNIAKEVKLKVEPKEDRKPLSYEQLNDACNQLAIQNNKLKRRCQELESFNAFKRLDYLFQVLDHVNNFDKDFVISCAEEIKAAIIIPEEKEEEV